MESGNLPLNCALDATVRASPGLGHEWVCPHLRWLQYLRDLPWKRPVSESCFRVQFGVTVWKQRYSCNQRGSSVSEGTDHMCVWSQETELLLRARASEPRSALGSVLDLKTSLGTRYIYCPHLPDEETVARLNSSPNSRASK